MTTSAMAEDQSYGEEYPWSDMALSLVETPERTRHLSRNMPNAFAIGADQ